MNGISFIIPTYKEPAHLDICLNSILNYKITNNENFEAIIIVDGTYDDNIDIIDKYRMHQNIRFINLPQNHGMCVAMNIGVQYAQYNKILIINDDHVLCKKWDTILLNDNIINDVSFPIHSILYFYSMEPIALPYNQKNVLDCGRTPKTFNEDKWVSFDMGIDFNVYSIIKSDIFNCRLPFMMYKYDYIAMGGWDSTFIHGLQADDDFFMRARLLGFDVYSLNNQFYFYHFAESTVNDTNLIANGKIGRRVAESKNIPYIKQKWNNYIVCCIPGNNEVVMLNPNNNKIVVNSNVNELYK